MEASYVINMVRIIVAIILLFASNVLAAGYTVTWGYTPPTSPAVTGYRLYCNTVMVVDFPGASTASGVVANGVLTIGDSFTLTALFDDLTESSHSAPYVWTGTNIAIRRLLQIKLNNTSGKLTGPGHVMVQ